MERRAVLFDLDGVLIDSYEAWFRVVQTVRRELGFEPVDRETFDSGWGQGVEDDAALLFPGRTVAEVDAAFNARFMDEIEHVVVFPGAASTLGALRDRGIALAIVTNTPSGLADRMLRGLGLRDAVDVLVGSGDVPREKPAPDMLLEAGRRLGVTMERAVMVGDSRYDREAARAAPVRYVGFRSEGDLTIDELSELPDRLGELT